MLLHQRARGYHGARADHGPVQYRSVHAHGHVVFDGGTVYDGVVAYRHAFSQRDRTVVIAVQRRIVLYVAVLADADRRHLSANDGTEPHRAIIIHSHVAAQDGVRRDERCLFDVGRHSLEFDEHGAPFA